MTESTQARLKRSYSVCMDKFMVNYSILSHFQSNNNDRLFLIATLQKLELLYK